MTQTIVWFSLQPAATDKTASNVCVSHWDARTPSSFQMYLQGVGKNKMLWSVRFGVVLSKWASRVLIMFKEITIGLVTIATIIDNMVLSYMSYEISDMLRYLFWVGWFKMGQPLNKLFCNPQVSSFCLGTATSGIQTSKYVGIQMKTFWNDLGSLRGKYLARICHFQRGILFCFIPFSKGYTILFDTPPRGIYYTVLYPSERGIKQTVLRGV